jgi:hypothetical protein
MTSLIWIGCGQRTIPPGASGEDEELPDWRAVRFSAPRPLNPILSQPGDELPIGSLATKKNRKRFEAR